VFCEVEDRGVCLLVVVGGLRASALSFVKLPC
jgi:hypothetical protein